MAPFISLSTAILGLVAAARSSRALDTIITLYRLLAYDPLRTDMYADAGTWHSADRSAKTQKNAPRSGSRDRERERVRVCNDDRGESKVVGLSTAVGLVELSCPEAGRAAL